MQTTTAMYSQAVVIREQLLAFQGELDRTQLRVDLIQKAYQLGLQGQVEYLGDLLCSAENMRSALGLCKEALGQIEQALAKRSAAAVDLLAGGSLNNHDVVAAATNDVVSSEEIIAACQAQATEYLRIFRMNADELHWPVFVWS